MSDPYTSAIVRAARQLRNISRNLLLEEPEALAAWNALDRALQAQDDARAAQLSAHTPEEERP